jgi:hypothetical protein
MKQTFKSSKHPAGIVVFYVIISLFILIPVFVGMDKEEEYVWIPLLICWSSAALFWWIVTKTYYEIEDNLIKYYSGPFRGKINIQSIRKIEYHDGWYIPSINKMSLDKKGLMVYYNKFDDIFISPADMDRFISKILDKNPEIVMISKNN